MKSLQDDVFLVHKDLAPSFFSFSALDPDLCKKNKTGAQMMERWTFYLYLLKERKYSF